MVWLMCVCVVDLLLWSVGAAVLVLEDAQIALIARGGNASLLKRLEDSASRLGEVRAIGKATVA